MKTECEGEESERDGAALKSACKLRQLNRSLIMDSSSNRLSHGEKSTAYHLKCPMTVSQLNVADRHPDRFFNRSHKAELVLSSARAVRRLARWEERMEAERRGPWWESDADPSSEAEIEDMLSRFSLPERTALSNAERMLIQSGGNVPKGTLRPVVSATKCTCKNTPAFSPLAAAKPDDLSNRDICIQRKVSVNPARQLYPYEDPSFIASLPSMTSSKRTRRQKQLAVTRQLTPLEQAANLRASV